MSNFFSNIKLPRKTKKKNKFIAKFNQMYFSIKLGTKMLNAEAFYAEKLRFEQIINISLLFWIGIIQSQIDLLLFT